MRESSRKMHSVGSSFPCLAAEVGFGTRPHFTGCQDITGPFPPSFAISIVKLSVLRAAITNLQVQPCQHVLFFYFRICQ